MTVPTASLAHASAAGSVSAASASVSAAAAAYAVPEGLAGVVVADTRISEVNGQAGRLIIAGSDVESLAAERSFEDVVGLVLAAGTGRAPPVDLAARLGAARVRAFARTDALALALRLDEPAAALRAFVAQLETPPAGDPFEEAIAVIAAVGVAAAAWPHRGAAPLAPAHLAPAHLAAAPLAPAHLAPAPFPPRPELSHAADLLRMIRGAGAAEATAEEVRALDGYLVTIVDHGLNASTFTARVVASTGSDLVSAVTAGIGALKGPLHGGAPGPVLDMFDAVGSPASARAWLEAELGAGRRIMGMGHRVYRVRDPRAFVLERLARELEASSPGVAARIALARAIEHQAEALLSVRHPDRPMRANVEFYTAILLEALALDRRLFTPMFAAGRVAGWCAHVFEQRAGGKLFRPEARYVGDRPRARP